MLRIRLARTGRKKLAHYRVVVSESHRTPTGGAATQIGYFNPHTEELSVDTDALQHYLDKGAQPSGRMVRLLQDRDDITLPEQAKQNLVVKEEKAPEPEEQTSEQTGQEAESQDETQASDTEEDPGDSASEEGSGKEESSDEPGATNTAAEEENASEDTEDTTGASETEKTS